MDTNRPKQAAQWYYSSVYRDEPIRPQSKTPDSPLPPLLRAARALAQGENLAWQSRESIFIKQAKLLVNYEDDCPYEKEVVRYFPTYQSFTDRELRGYFTWRTQLRKGNLHRTSLSFAFLYIYELLNQIGVSDPLSGYQRLLDFKQSYGQVDEKVLPYLRQWLIDYVVYYNLSADLLNNTPQAQFDRSVEVLERSHIHTPDEVVAAVKFLSSKWLERSKFYAAHTCEFEQALVRVLIRVQDHYAARCKKSMTDQFFGTVNRYPLMLFNSAVFLDTQKVRDRDYIVDDSWHYQCRGGLWSAARRTCTPLPSPKLTNLLKALDGVMRQEFGFGHPIQFKPEPKWTMRILQEETLGVLAEIKAREKTKISIDYSQLAQIRRDAAVTQEKLTVDEEEDWIFSPSPVPASPLPPADTPSPVCEPECPLSPEEYRILKCLLYGGDLSWATAEGFLLSVLADSINEKLYDQFQDSVLQMDDVPVLVEDYINDLKEMVLP